MFTPVFTALLLIKYNECHAKLFGFIDPLISSDNRYFCMQQITVNCICRTKVNQFDLFFINPILRQIT